MIVTLPSAQLEALRLEVRAASWFAALGEPLTEGDRSDAVAYGTALGFDSLKIGLARDWPEAERLLKAPGWTPAWWDREEALRRTLLAEAEARYPERALWSSLTDLTTEPATSCTERPRLRPRAWARRRRPRSMSRRVLPRRRFISWRSLAPVRRSVVAGATALDGR